MLLLIVVTTRTLTHVFDTKTYINECHLLKVTAIIHAQILKLYNVLLSIYELALNQNKDWDLTSITLI